MRLYVDAIGITSSGGAAVLTDTVRELSAAGGFQRITVFVLPEPRRSFALEVLPGVDYRPVGWAAGLMGRVVWQQFALPLLCRRGRADAVLNLANVGAAFPTVPQVVYCQQALPFFYEPGVGLGRLQRLRTWLLGRFIAAGAKRSSSVVCQTETMSKALQSAAGMAPERFRVVAPLMSSRSTAPAAGGSAPVERLVLGYVAHPAEQKNFQVLIGALSILEASRIPCTLSLTLDRKVRHGRYGGFVRAIEGAAEARGVSHRIRWAGMLPESQVGDFIAGLDAFIFPSLVESFPLPLLRAMEAGKPLLLADRPYARDIAGDAARYFDPRDAGSIAGLVERLWRDAGLRERLSAASSARGRLLDSRDSGITEVVRNAAGIGASC